MVSLPSGTERPGRKSRGDAGDGIARTERVSGRRRRAANSDGLRTEALARGLEIDNARRPE